MSRTIALLLCFCITILCSFVGYMGLAEQRRNQESQTCPSLSCATVLKPGFEMIQSSPFELVEFQNGKSFAPFDIDHDGEWDEVYVPMFPANTKRLATNYGAVIVHFGNVSNKEQLQDAIASDRLKVEAWQHFPKLEAETYFQMAKQYPSMDFNRCVLVHSGFPEKANFGFMLIVGSGLGITGSILFAGWQCIGFIRHASQIVPPTLDDAVSNRFGLPTESGGITEAVQGRPVSAVEQNI